MPSIIKTSQKGVDYAEPCVLKSKKTVHSKALLMKIPHDHPDENDISLKIGRYKNPFGQIETEKPRSELTLDNDELNSLIEYISENYSPITLGQGEYINVTGRAGVLVQQFKRLVEVREDTAKLLIDNNILTDKVYIAASIIKKSEAIQSFQLALAESHPEHYWQEWFENNKWMLGSDFAHIIDERVIDSDNIADYIIQAFDGFIDLVEIKKPDVGAFWASKLDHGNYIPSGDLVKAITQCLNYLRAIEEQSNNHKFIVNTGSKVIKPRCTLIFGRSNDWNNEQKEAYRVLNGAYNQLSIMTYDHLLDRAKNVLDLYPEDEIPF